MLGEYDNWLARSHGRVGRYREQVERFREIAKMEMQPRVRARLLELAEQYEQLVDDLAGAERCEDPEGSGA
jgi:hypothetical protein